MGKIVPRKFKISKAGPAGVAGAAESIRRQGSGANNAAAHAFAARGSGGGAGGAGSILLPGGPSEIAVNAVNFDGTSDWLTRDGGLTGAVDNDLALISLWFDMAGGDGVAQNFVRGLTASQFRIRRQVTNDLLIQLETGAGAIVWAFLTDDTFLAAGGWHHFLVAVNASASKRLIYIDDAVAGIHSVTENAGDIDWTETDWAIGSSTAAGAERLNADLAEMYFTNEFLDISVEANRRKFISAGGKPVDLETDGSGPTGTAPLVYFSGATDSWHTNAGSGEGFTEVGELTDAASSPSD